MNLIRPRALLPGALLFALSLLSGAAMADASPEDRASADLLYNDAAKLMGDGKYAEACPKLRASQKLDPAIGTLLKLGFCFTNTGQTASAWASFNDAEAMARKAFDKRAEQAAKQARELSGKLSKLTITAAEGGVEVQRDGVVVDPGLLGTALPVDPGAHTISATAAGKEPWSLAITVAAGPGTMTVSVPALTAAAVAKAAAASEAAVYAPPAEAAAAPSGWSRQRTAGLILGGGGVVSVVLGSVFGALTLSKTGEARKQCSAAHPPQCSKDGLKLYTDAETTANVSNVWMGLGGAALIGGVVLFLTAPSGAPAAPAKAARVHVVPVVGAGTTGVVLQGVW
jgi:hypothetical protein